MLLLNVQIICLKKIEILYDYIRSVVEVKDIQQKNSAAPPAPCHPLSKLWFRCTFRPSLFYYYIVGLVPYQLRDAVVFGCWLSVPYLNRVTRFIFSLRGLYFESINGIKIRKFQTLSTGFSSLLRNFDDWTRQEVFY